jgi:hypothetical protein
MTGECETCKFWKRNQDNRFIGDCCIRAPWVILDPDGGRPDTWFPRTVYNQGCGEHEPKQADIDNPTEDGAA